MCIVIDEEERQAARRNTAMIGNVRSSSLCRLYVAIVYRAGTAMIQFAAPKLSEVYRTCLGVDPFSAKVVLEWTR